MNRGRAFPPLFLGVILLSAVLSVAACAPSPTPAPTPTPPVIEPEPAPHTSPSPTPTPTPTPRLETLTYSDSEYGFSVEYPKDWDLEEGILEAIVMFAGPLVEEEQFMISVGIMADELPEFPKTTLEDYVRISRLKSKKALDNYNTIDEYSTVVDDVTAMVERFTFDFNGYVIMGTQAIFLRENVAYVVTYTATPGCHDDYLDCFELALSTFRFEPEPTPTSGFSSTTYENDTYGYSISYPSDWMVDVRSIHLTQFNPPYPYFGGISIMMYEATDLPIEEQVQIWAEVMRDLFNNFTILDSRERQGMWDWYVAINYNWNDIEFHGEAYYKCTEDGLYQIETHFEKEDYDVYPLSEIVDTFRLLSE
jgi:hypothetical protein